VIAGNRWAVEASSVTVTGGRTVAFAAGALRVAGIDIAALPSPPRPASAQAASSAVSSWWAA